MQRSEQHSSRVFNAAYIGDFKTVFSILVDGFGVNAKDESGDTLLAIAAKHLRTDVIHALVFLGANVNEKNYAGQNALQIVDNCVGCGIMEIFEAFPVRQVLINYGSEVSGPSSPIGSAEISFWREFGGVKYTLPMICSGKLSTESTSVVASSIDSIFAKFHHSYLVSLDRSSQLKIILQNISSSLCLALKEENWSKKSTQLIADLILIKLFEINSNAKKVGAFREREIEQLVDLKLFFKRFNATFTKCFLGINAEFNSLIGVTRLPLVTRSALVLEQLQDFSLLGFLVVNALQTTKVEGLWKETCEMQSRLVAQKHPYLRAIKFFDKSEEFAELSTEPGLLSVALYLLQESPKRIIRPFLSYVLSSINNASKDCDAIMLKIDQGLKKTNEGEKTTHLVRMINSRNLLAEHSKNAKEVAMLQGEARLCNFILNILDAKKASASLSGAADKRPASLEPVAIGALQYFVIKMLTRDGKSQPKSVEGMFC